MLFVVKEGSSDYKKVRKRWFFKEPLTEWFFNDIPVNNFLSIFFLCMMESATENIEATSNWTL